jgi:hypothetical protein
MVKKIGNLKIPDAWKNLGSFGFKRLARKIIKVLKFHFCPQNFVTLEKSQC